MKYKRIRNYYSKLSLISISAVFILVMFITTVVLVSLHKTRVSELMGACNEILDELFVQYDSIWDDYYKAFVPLNSSFYAKDLQDFCKEEGSVYDQYKSQEKLERILANVCQQDNRITGVYFRRLSDDSRYFYSDKTDKMEEVHFSMSDSALEDVNQRSIIGGRIIGVKEIISKDKDIIAYGIQSKLLSSSGLEGSNDYQITVMYEMSSFDSILSEYNLSSAVRFYLMTQQGMILYDSQGEYAYNEATYFGYTEKMLHKDEEIIIDQDIYLIDFRESGRNQCLAFYMIPQSELSVFEFSTLAKLVIIFGVIINIIMILVMLSLNRLTTQKFHMLENGMQQIGKNNLSYRIAVGRNEDEFARIAKQFNIMCDDLEDMINKNYIYQILQRNAEYKALQTSINPHFLYNSLEALREKVDNKGMKDEAEMILLLSRIFEYQIRGKSIVTIEKELSALQNYIDFYSIRLQYGFEYFIDFEDEILDYLVPKQIFQPIMENYFSHGFRGDGTDVICINGYLDEEEHMLHVCFSDNGKGIEEEQLKKLKASLDEKQDETTHIGLRNVHNRLKIVFDNDSRVEIMSNFPKPGISVSLIFSRTLKKDIL